MSNVQQRMARGIVWMVAARLADRSIGVVSTLILARMLIPDDFGVVAMAMVVAGVLDLLGAFSFDLALIQNKDAGANQYNTVWTISVLFGLFCGVVLAALAIPASIFYREPRLEAVMYALAVSYLIGGFSNVGIVNFRKDLQFRNEFKFALSRRLLTFIVTIGCALWWRSYWALVAGTIAGRVGSVCLSYVMSDYRPAFTLSAGRELLHFSKWLFLNNILFFLLHSGPNFVIGRMSGAFGLGTYTVAYEISNLPSTELVAPINRATFPGFAKMKGVEEMANSYVKLLGIIILLIPPLGVGIAAVAEPLVLTALGEKWVASIPLIKLLAIYGAIAATQANNGVIWIALGRPRDVTMSAAFFVATLFPALYWLLGAYGLLGAGYAYMLAQITNVPAAMWNTRRLLLLTWTRLASVAWRPSVALFVMYASVLVLDESLRSAVAWQRLIADSLAGAALYIATTLTLWLVSRRPDGAERFCIDRFESGLGKLRLAFK